MCITAIYTRFLLLQLDDGRVSQETGLFCMQIFANYIYYVNWPIYTGHNTWYTWMVRRERLSAPSPAHRSFVNGNKVIGHVQTEADILVSMLLYINVEGVLCAFHMQLRPNPNQLRSTRARASTVQSARTHARNFLYGVSICGGGTLVAPLLNRIACLRSVSMKIKVLTAQHKYYSMVCMMMTMWFLVIVVSVHILRKIQDVITRAQ